MVSQDVCFIGVGSSYDVIESVEELRDYPKSELWRQLVNQVESSLCREDRSRQALDQLQQLATEQGASTQFLLKSVIRETIRLTMECLADAKELILRATTSEPEENLLRTPVLTPEELEAQADARMVTALNHVLTPVATKGNFLDRLRLPAPATKQDPVVLHQQALETYEQQMRFLCGRFHAQRKRVGLDLAQIHATTFIALHHLKALDNGDIHHLPEAVYLRGFLRRLEPCLDLPVGSLTDALPTPVPTTPVCKATAPRNVQTHPDRTGFQAQYAAYLAYGALMAGGIYAIAQQGAPKSQLPPLRIDTPSPATVSHPRKVSFHQPVQLSPSQTIAEPEFVRSSRPESRTINLS